MTIISAIFDNYDDAAEAIVQIENAGIANERISLVMTDETRGKHFGLKDSSKADEGVATGASLGGALGAIAGLVAGAGVIAIPGLNLVVTGTIVTALAGLGAGATAGGLLGGLVGAGIPEHEAKMYDRDIRSGKVMVAVETNGGDEKKTVKNIFDDLSAHPKAA